MINIKMATYRSPFYSDSIYTFLVYRKIIEDDIKEN